MSTLAEIKSKISNKTRKGRSVNVLAYHSGQVYPIIAETEFNGVWEADNFSQSGVSAFQLGDCDELVFITKAASAVHPDEVVSKLGDAIESSMEEWRDDE